MDGRAEESAALDHLKPRYSETRVCRIFNISHTTLKRWITEGLIAAVKIGPRKLEFEVDEVERRYRVCRGQAGGDR
jgi:predicted site-specific integrase-resolvase